MRAGLYLWNDDLAESHARSQHLPSPTGSYWHGLMHRREGDLDNAAYWFRRVGAHPVFPAVRRYALARAEARAGCGDRWCEARLAELRRADAWDPFAFLNGCRAAGAHPWLAEVQAFEMDELLAHGVREPDRALGSGPAG